LRGGVFVREDVILQHYKFFPIFVVSILLLLVTVSYSRAKTYKWDDYSIPFKGEFIFTPSTTIKVDLPDYFIKRHKEIPLIIKHSGLGIWSGSGSDEVILRINDQSLWNSYYIGRGRTYSDKPIRLIIRSEDLKSGINKLTFVDHRTGTSRRGGGKIYELRFETVQQENLETLDAKKDITNVKKSDKIFPQTKPSKTVDSKKSYISEARWALVIGISNYQDSRIPSLRYAASDAKAFYDWLISPSGGRYAPSRVKLLLNEKATGGSIKRALFEWLGETIEEDIVTIFFAGHGSPQSPDKPENLFLLPYDTQYDSVATTGFPMWDIETALKRFIKAKKVVVITDACHAGGVGQSFDVARREGRGINIIPISSNLQNLSKIGDGICIISASDDSQYSQESKKWGGGHGVFTYYLLQGLKGEADYSKDNRVSLGEIIPYLSEQVRRATRNTQTPTVAGRFDPALTIGK
jgi:hypothetical protein